MAVRKPKFDFPEVIDNTMRSDFVSCPRRFFYSHIKNLKIPSKSLDLHFGGCFAKGIEVTRKAFYGNDAPSTSDLSLKRMEGGGTISNEIAAIALGAIAIIREWGDFETPEDATKNLISCLDAFLSYFIQYPLGSDSIRPFSSPNGPLVECSFALPIPGTKHPQTGNPIIYAGRFDMIGVFNDANFVVDEKTTKALGPTWGNQWKLRAQFTGYVWGAQEYGIPIQGVIIRGIAILKKDITFAEAIETRSKWEIERWLTQLQRDVKRMIASYRKHYWDFNLDASCSAYFGCPYLQLCDSQFPERWESNYEIRKWNPLKRSEG